VLSIRKNQRLCSPKEEGPSSNMGGIDVDYKYQRKIIIQKMEEIKKCTTKFKLKNEKRLILKGNYLSFSFLFSFSMCKKKVK